MGTLEVRNDVDKAPHFGETMNPLCLVDEVLHRLLEPHDISGRIDVALELLAKLDGIVELPSPEHEKCCRNTCCDREYVLLCAGARRLTGDTREAFLSKCENHRCDAIREAVDEEKAGDLNGLLVKP